MYKKETSLTTNSHVLVFVFPIRTDDDQTAESERERERARRETRDLNNCLRSLRDTSLSRRRTF